MVFHEYNHVSIGVTETNFSVSYIRKESISYIYDKCNSICHIYVYIYKCINVNIYTIYDILNYTLMGFVALA